MQSLIDPIRYNLRNLTRFSGRQGRPSFWIYVAATYVFFQVISMMVMAPVMFSMMSGPFPDQTGVGSTVTTVMLISVGMMVLWLFLLLAAIVRRLHDRGLVGWFALLPAPGYALMMSHMPAWMEMFMRPEVELDLRRFEPLMWGGLVFYAGLGLLIVLLALKGQPGENRFGPPMEVETD